MAILHRNIQLMLEFFKAPFLVLHFSYYKYINDLPDVICDIAIYADDTTLYSIWYQASDMWQQLEFVSELEFDLRDTVDWDKKGFFDFSAWKTQLVLFDQWNNNGSTDVKMYGSVPFKMLGLIFSSKLNWRSYIISIAKTNCLQENWTLNSFYQVSFS